MEKYNLKEGINIITLLIINKLTNINGMFSQCISLLKIDELKYLIQMK